MRWHFEEEGHLDLRPVDDQLVVVAVLAHVGVLVLVGALVVAVDLLVEGGVFNL